MTITIGVCGAGTMGSGIAQVAAQSGFNTILFDLNNSALDHAKLLLEKNLDYQIKKGKISADEKSALFGRLKFTDDLKECSAELIIEAISENENAKISLFDALSTYNNEEVIFATNTSSLSVSALQEKIRFPERFIGMHFFNPATILKLVEVVRGRQTGNDVVIAVHEICLNMGKVPVICKDSPGFIVNRIARHYYLESLRMMEEGMATFEEIDSILESAGFKMGPFRLMDLIGMDINLAVSQRLYEAFNKEERFKPSPVQTEMVKNGLLGKKTGKGFYNYSAPGA